ISLYQQFSEVCHRAERIMGPGNQEQEAITPAPPTHSTAAKYGEDDAEKPSAARPPSQTGQQQSTQIDPAVASKIAANVDDFMILRIRLLRTGSVTELQMAKWLSARIGRMESKARPTWARSLAFRSPVGFPNVMGTAGPSYLP
ncbi:protease S8 tripeptidyl peptidase I, partial [Apiospora arundinis]